jgi:hypothetical protein
MACIMDPPIGESCRRIGEHLVQLTKPLDLVVISGGNSEVPGMIPRLRAMLRARSIVSDDDKVIHLTGQSSSVSVQSRRNSESRLTWTHLQKRGSPRSPLLD